ncbi:MAG TPA: hypothetical protein VFH68_17260 [Polyangia bacterium]|nr:hypothetical protein [Polyangia bacterium]
MLALSVLTVLLTTWIAARDARADVLFEAPPPPARRLGMAISAALLGAAIGVELVLPRFRFELHADATPPPPPPPPYDYPAAPPPPCCYAPPPPPPVMIAEPAPLAPQEPDFPRFGVAVNGLIQSTQTSGAPAATAGVAVSLQARTSRRSIFAIEVQSLDAERSSRRRTDQAGLLVGRLFLWDHPIAPYLDLAGGLGRAAIDTQNASVATSEVIGRVGLGLEMRLGPHLVLEGQVARVYKLRLDHEPGGPQPADPTFIGERELATELRGGLAYRF